MRKFPCSQIVSADMHSVKVRLVRLNWNQDRLAVELGVTHSTMSNWLTCVTNIPFVARLALEDILRSAEVETFGSAFPCPLSDYLLVENISTVCTD